MFQLKTTKIMQKIIWTDPQRSGKTHNIQKAHVPVTTLDIADVGPMQIRKFCQFFLGKAHALPVAANGLPESSLYAVVIHNNGAKRPRIQTCGLQTLRDIMLSVSANEGKRSRLHANWRHRRVGVLVLC